LAFRVEFLHDPASRSPEKAISERTYELYALLTSQSLSTWARSVHRWRQMGNIRFTVLKYKTRNTFENTLEVLHQIHSAKCIWYTKHKIQHSICISKVQFSRSKYAQNL